MEQQQNQPTYGTGNQSIQSIQSLLSFFLDRVHMLHVGGVPHRGGLPRQPVRVTCFGEVSFLHVKVVKWGNLPNRGYQITRSWQIILPKH